MTGGSNNVQRRSEPSSEEDGYGNVRIVKQEDANQNDTAQTRVVRTRDTTIRPEHCCDETI